MDIEHIVAPSEAHDSEFCSVNAERKNEFARNLLDFMLASPLLNHHQKSADDVADWVPEMNVCWFDAAHEPSHLRRRWAEPNRSRLPRARILNPNQAPVGRRRNT